MDLKTNIEDNPWIVEQLEEFLYFCCPECDEKCQAKVSFLQHAILTHPNSELSLKKFQTLKIEQDPFENNDSFHFTIIKEEQEEFNSIQETALEEPKELEFENWSPPPFEQQFNDNTQDGNLAEDTAINFDNEKENKSRKKSRKDWVKNHSSEVQCYKCASIVLKDKIETHLIQVHDCHIKKDFGPIRQYKCELCGRAYIKKHKCDAIKRKKKIKGSKKPCELCGKSFSDLRSLKEHKKTAHESGGTIFKCELCEYSNISKRNLASHVKLRHEKDKFKYFCSVCGKKFATAYLVTNHERKVHFSKDSDAMDQFSCDKCGGKQMTRTAFRKHMMLVHGDLVETSATCEKCGKHFTNLQCFQDHVKQSHPTANELAKVQCYCEKCTEVFTYAEGLNAHLKACLENPPNLTCPICSTEDWYSVIALKKHSAEKHEKHIRVCNICQATYESYDKFRQHKTIHKEKKKTMHPCPHCNQEYEIKKSLKRHMLRVHGDADGETHYSCDKCDYVNKSHPKYQEHINAIHTKEVVYHCDQCTFTTYRKSNLQPHLKNVHEKYKPNKCDKCFAAFLTKRELNKHFENKHPGLK